MGIKGLPGLIEKLSGNDAVYFKNISEFKNQSIAVDVSMIIYQSAYALRAQGTDMKNSNGEITSHLHGLFYKTLNFLKHGITPIYVFDGKAPNSKNSTIQKRKQTRILAEEKLKTLKVGDNDYLKNYMESFKPTRFMYDSSKKLLDLMGIPYIIAPGEADVICAWLTCRKNEKGEYYANGVCSEDSDMLAHGSRYLLKNMIKAKSDNLEVKVFDLHKILVKLNFTINQFQDMCVLLGCDSCDQVVGPKQAYNLISKHGTLEEVCNNLIQKEKYTNLDTNCLIEARNYFKNAVKKIDKNKCFVLTDSNIKLSLDDSEGIINFMCKENNFEVQRIKTGLIRLNTYYADLKVTNENKNIVIMTSDSSTDSPPVKKTKYKLLKS